MRLFASLPDQERFYLTGGTALAEYYLAHRLSYDLDLFTREADLIVPFSNRVEQAAQSAGMEIAVVRRFASFVEFQSVENEDTLEVDLALDSSFRFAPVELGYAGVMVNDSQDVRTDKILAFSAGLNHAMPLICIFFCKTQNSRNWQNLRARKIRALTCTGLLWL